MTSSCKVMRDLIRKECVKEGIFNEDQIDYITATAMWETNHTCLPVKEAYWLSEAWRKRHLRYYPYYGRGLVQITWKNNYERFGKLLDIDLVNSPDMALDIKYAVKILVIGMRDGLFTGFKLSQFIGRDRHTNFIGARSIVNGRDKAHVIASMARDIKLA